jgi:predicted XRE-type DNA-binding protein
MSKDTNTRVIRGSGNVFADLGLPNPEEHLAKAELVSELKCIIDREGWTQARAAQVMGMAQPDVSRLLRGQFANYSIDRLLRFLSAAGCQVDITVRRPGEKTADTIHVYGELEPA